MGVRIRGAKDFFAGLLLVAFGAAATYLARDYPMGSSLRMGPGYFPTVLGVLLAFIGAVVLVRGLLVRHEPPHGFALRSVVFVLGAVLLFGLSLERLGIVVAVLLVVSFGALAAREQRWLEIAGLAAVMLGLAVGAFTYGLGLPFKVWPT